MSTHTKKFLYFFLFISLFPETLFAGGKIIGFVSYKGIPPVPKKFAVTMSSDVCGTMGTSESLLIGKRQGVQNAVVFIDGPVSGSKKIYSESSQPPVLTIKNCRFEPHVILVGVNDVLKILNQDTLPHHFETTSITNGAFSKIVPTLGESQVVFKAKEIFEAKCGLFPWMSSWFVIAEHAYYSLTNQEGRYELSDLPAGDYTLSLWHEILGQQTKRVIVKEGETIQVDWKIGSNLD